MDVPWQFKMTQSNFAGIVYPFLQIIRLLSEELEQGLVIMSIFICSWIIQVKKLPEFIQNIIDRLFNQCNIDLKHFKQQYDPEVKRKEESRFKGFNLFNKKEIEKATKHINDKMDEYAEEFYSNKKQKDDDLSL